MPTMSAATRAVHVVGMSRIHQAPPILRDRAAYSVLATAAAAVPASARRQIITHLHRGGPWDALRTLASEPTHSGISPAAREVATLIANPKWGRTALESLERDEREGIWFLTPADASWPAQLNDLGDLTPIALWGRGKLPDLSDGSVAVVGSRAFSTRGEDAINRLVTGLPVPVVSGLAIGTDGAAHRAALERGIPTIAVLPSGVDRVYPHDHEQLAEQIVHADGALISELPPGVTPTRHRFLDRNRLIAALGTGSLIIEAGSRSGTMNEAGHAHRLGRRIAAVPGTTGADQLIRTGAAYPVQCTADIDALYAAQAAA